MTPMTSARIDARLDEGPPGSALCIALTSYGNDGRPPGPEDMEWSYTLRDLACHKLHLLDVFQHWYHGPILGFSADLSLTVERVRGIIDRLRPSRVVTLGTSMGGYGALLLGSLLKVDVACTMAPQVDVSAGWLAEIGDRRWIKYVEINAIGYPDLDITKLYEVRRPRRTMIYYDAADPLDTVHAERLRKAPGVELMPRSGTGHLLAYDMVMSGEATGIMRQILMSDS